MLLSWPRQKPRSRWSLKISTGYRVNADPMFAHQAKIAKRSQRDLYEGSKLVEMAKKQQSYEEMFMQVNPLQLGGASKGKSKDIHLTNIDVSFGSNRILWVEAGCFTDLSLSC